jgi:azurin
VYRITAKGRPLLDPPRIDGQPIAAQLDLLKAYEDRTRYEARLALRSQPTDAVVKAIPEWIARLDANDAGYEHHLLEALWVYQHHDVVEPDLLKRLLQAKEPRARAAATRVLQHWYDRVEGAMGLVRQSVKDPAPRVRLEAVRLLSFVPTREAAETALEALRQPTDYYLEYVLDSTMSTLEKVWKPVLTSGKPFPADNADGLAFLLARLEPSELSSAPAGVPAFRAMLERSGIEPRIRQQALEGLAKLNGSQPLRELIAALDRLDGKPASAQPTQDLAKMLVTVDPSALSSARSDLERVALRSRNEAARQGGFAALVRADGGSSRAWDLAGASPQSRVDLMRAAAQSSDASLFSGLYPHLVAQLTGNQSTPRHTLQPISGRYVRITFPGRERTLRLAEVQVFSGGANVAPKGAASQSSYVAGATVGGQAEKAIDGNTDAEQKAASTAYTRFERDPWWELDLREVRAIDSIAIWNQVSGDSNRPGGFHLAILDGAREPVFVRDGVSSATAGERIALGGDLTPAVMAAAIAALPAIPGHDTESLTLLTRLAQGPDTRQAAIAAIGRLPRESWASANVASLAEAVAAYIRDFPPAERTGAEFKQVVALGRELAVRLPGADKDRISTTIDRASVRTIRIEAVRAAMRFNVANFTVQAGEEVEIEFVNPDDMPHNLLVTVPGALETVGLKAEAMIKEPDAFAQSFVPRTNEVLVSTKLIGTGETARLRFTAPSKPDSYPYVCTFPGHWRTMNGTMSVVRSLIPNP